MILKYIQKQLKLRTIRILRERHLMDYTCVAVRSIRFGMSRWYVKQVKKYAEINGVNSILPFFEMSLKRKSEVWEERLIFLCVLEQEVIAGIK